MSKLNKQKRGRRYADGVQAHVQRVRSQQLRCDVKNKELDSRIKELEATCTKVAERVKFIQSELVALHSDIHAIEDALKTVGGDLGTQRLTTSVLSVNINIMSSIISETAHRLGIDTSKVEPAEADEDVRDSLAAVEEEATKATVESMKDDVTSAEVTP